MARTPPKQSVLRSLYMRSGNTCAFPGCDQLIVTEKNLYVCEVVHIEAAEPLGERYNAAQSDDQRRDYPNLMLMCHPHHVETDDVTTFTVPVLQKMKADHEAKFMGQWKQPSIDMTEILEKMSKELAKEDLYIDWTTVIKPILPKSCEKIWAVMGLKAEDPDRAQYVNAVCDFASLLSQVPIKTRSVMAVIVERGERKAGEKIEALIPEIEAAGKKGADYLLPQFQILEKMGYGGIDTDEGKNLFVLTSTLVGWPIWFDLKDFFEKANGLTTGLWHMFVELDFSVLD